MANRLFPDAIRTLFAIEPDSKFCMEPGRPALYLNKPKDKQDESTEEWLNDENLKRSVEEAKAAEYHAKRKHEEQRRYLVAKLFPPGESAPTLKPAKDDPMARPVRRTMTAGGRPSSDMARSVADGYLTEKIQKANVLLKRLRSVRQELTDQVRKMSTGVHSASELSRLTDAIKDIKFQLNKISKTVRIANGAWMQYKKGTINVLLMAFVGDINFRCIDVTSQFEQLVEDGGVRGAKLNVNDFVRDIGELDDDSLTLIFMGKDMEESSISKHHTGLTWTPKFKHSPPAQDLQPAAQPRAERDISEGDVVLRDLFNGYSKEPEVRHTPFMTSQITDLEMEMMKYEAGGMVCCSRDAPPTIALFIA